MKKRILLLMTLILFSCVTTSQNGRFNRLKVKTTPAASSSDEVLAIKPSGLLVNTGVTLQTILGTSDVFRKSDLTTPADSFTEDIFHNGGLMLNGKLKDPSNFNHFGTTLIDNIKIGGTTVQTDNIASSLKLIGNSGIVFNSGNGNINNPFIFQANSGFVSTTAEELNFASFSRNLSLPSAYARDPNLFGIVLNGNIDYTQSTNYNNQGDFTAFSSQINPSGVGNVYALGGVGAIKLSSYGSGSVNGTEAFNLSVDAEGNFIETPIVNALIKRDPNTFGHYLDYFRDEANYGDVGGGAIDFSYSFTPSTTFGATGSNSFAQGERTTASGYGSWSTGFEGVASDTYAFQHGYQNTSNGYSGTVFGYGSVLSNDYGFVAGTFNNQSSRYGGTIGVGLLNKTTSTFVVGQANTDYDNSGSNFNNPDHPMFIVGNGDLAAGTPNNAGTRSDAFRIDKSGRITAPSLELAEIDTDKSLITKEFADANYNNLWQVFDFGGGPIEPTPTSNGTAVLQNYNQLNYTNIVNEPINQSYWQNYDNGGSSGINAVSTGINANGDYEISIGLAQLKKFEIFNVNPSVSNSNAAKFYGNVLTDANFDLESGNGLRVLTDNSVNTMTFDFYNISSNDGRFVFGSVTNTSGELKTVFDGSGGVEVEIDHQEGKITAKKLNLDLSTLPVYDTDGAAGTGGLVAGDVYRTTAGVLMIKL